jgi:hypothetical protein
MKFFRKIRKSLILEGGLKRYTAYAIGEILLIMIGVLLACQVSKWNENRNNKRAETIYYQNIKRQLIEDKGLISRNIEYNDRYLVQFRKAVGIIETKDLSQADTLAAYALNLFRYSDFHRVNNIYETLLQSGQLKLIQNNNILEELQRLEESYVYINKMEDIHFDVIKLIAIPDLIKYLDFQTVQIERPEELYQFEFKNRFSMMMEIMREKDEVYDRTIYKINKIIALIDNELAPDRVSK